MLLRPRLRAANKMNDSTLRGMGDWLDILSQVGVFLVLFGLAAEFGVALLTRHGKSWEEAWGPVIATAAIGIGIALEWAAHHVGRQADAELDRRSEERLEETRAEAAEANERAANANERAERLALEAKLLEAAVVELRDPRELADEQRKQLLGELQAVADVLSSHVGVTAPADAESQEYAAQFLSVFREAGLEMERDRPGILFIGGLRRDDLLVLVSPKVPLTNGVAPRGSVGDVLCRAVRSAGFLVNIDHAEWMDDGAMLFIPSKQKPKIIEL